MKKVIDVLIYIALKEEFENVLQEFGIDFQAQELKKIAITVYDGEIIDRSGRSFLVRLVNAGRMGNTASGVNMSSLIDEFKPLNVVVLGIAGAISNDLKPGDIFIPSRIDEYLANSAAVGDISNDFIPSGNFYEADRRLLDRFRNFASVYKDSYRDWKLDCTSILERVIIQEKLDNLNSLNINLTEPELVVGDDRSLASGHSVVKGKAFTDWLKKKFDRKIAAVEMESAGIFEAVNSKIRKPRVLAIRPISDYADERKEKIEEIVGNNVRTLCMRNAVSLIYKAIFEGVFQPEKKKTVHYKKGQLINKVFIIGGMTDQMESSSFEFSDLKRVCYGIGKILAKEGIDLIACSPFTDSADFEAISGFSDAKRMGKIFLHYPNQREILFQKQRLEDHIGDKHSKIVPYLHPGYSNDEGRQQAWLLCQLLALEQADMVIAIGGKTSKSASVILHMAETRGIMIVPIPFLGGVAKEFFDRINWKDLYPNVKTEKLLTKECVNYLAQIMKQMKIDSLAQKNSEITTESKIFISRARNDGHVAEILQNKLKGRGLTVFLGDYIISEERSVIPAIEEYLNISDLIIVLWSVNYALSPWCYDELMIAINRHQNRQSTLLIFNIDGTPIVPANARSIGFIKGNDAEVIDKAISEIFNF